MGEEVTEVGVLLLQDRGGLCSSAAVWRLLHRHGWSWQCPARRALERDEQAVGLWKKDVWPPAE
ncbi:winged helix-turn-helix domain-containing protein [Streptomyces sp. NPDC088560]|uniref:helix-turn-helix domain-containing protein n=1 Tax=Streptomyces sp. NPDC088560 TaxID=3365868 RepID=UPI00381F0993